MNITIEREKLLKPLTLIAGVVEKRQTLPILANVYFGLDTGILTIVGTDLEIEITDVLEDITGERGEFTVTARKILDICKALPSEANIKMDLKQDKLVLRSGKSRFTLQTLPAKDFPKLETESWTNEFRIEQRQLKDLLEKTSFSMAHQDVRYYLNGLMLETSQNKLRAVATDGHRLAKSEIDIDNNAIEQKQFIVPRKAILELTRLLESEEETATLKFNNSHMCVSFGNLVFISKLIDGRFPDYDEVISPNLAISLEMNRHQFLDILTRASILTNEKFRGVKVTLENENMLVTAHNPEQEEAIDEMPIDYTGENMEIGFNVTYLIDALRVIDTESVEFRLNDPNSSCTLNRVGGSETQYLVMPMRI